MNTSHTIVLDKDSVIVVTCASTEALRRVCEAELKMYNKFYPMGPVQRCVSTLSKNECDAQEKNARSLRRQHGKLWFPVMVDELEKALRTIKGATVSRAKEVTYSYYTRGSQGWCGGPVGVTIQDEWKAQRRASKGV